MRVLVVDPDPNTRDVVRGVLERRGFRVSSAGDDKIALALTRALEPDLILVDALTPGLDGAEFLAAWDDQDAPRRAPVVLMAALPREREPGSEIGPRRSPFDVEGLMAAIHATTTPPGTPRP